MEYIEGFSLSRVLKERAHMIFHPDACNRDTSLGVGFTYDTSIPKTPPPLSSVRD
jgi:hypothetical protein